MCIRDRKDTEPEKLIGFLKEMEFKTLTEKKSRELNVDSENIKPTNQVSPQINVVSSPDKKENNKISNEFLRENYQIITNKEDLQKWYNKAEEIGYVAFDTETNSLDAVSADMVGFSLCTSDNDACYVPLMHINTCLLYTSPSPRDRQKSRMPSSA